METIIRNHLKASVTGTGTSAALRALHNLFGMSGLEISTALGRDRSTVHLYLRNQQKMPPRVRKRLRETLLTAITVARTIKCQDESEDELLAAIIERTEAILENL